jgi:hypothetical protein
MAKDGEPAGAGRQPQQWLALRAAGRGEAHQHEGEQANGGADDQQRIALGLRLGDDSDGILA